jgi:catechol 2,3-dioxygenase-like lactoylglutathione lyase family enzyme
MATPTLRWSYTGLRVQNLARSIRFYEKLGFQAGKRGRMEHGGQWAGLALPDGTHQLELNFYPTTNRFYEPFRAGTEFDHLGFEVDDIDAWVRLLRRRRLPIVADFTERDLRLVYTRDPDGNWVELCGPIRPPSPTGRRRA